MASSSSWVSDEELLALADSIGPKYYFKLGVGLGFTLSRLEQIERECLVDPNRTLLKIIRIWRDGEPEYSNVRRSFAEKLSQAKLNIQAGKLMKGTLSTTAAIQPSTLSRIETPAISKQFTYEGTRKRTLSLQGDRQSRAAPCTDMPSTSKFVKTEGAAADIMSEWITPALSVEDCQRRLKDHYESVTCQMQIRPWDKKDFVKLDQLYTTISLYKEDKDSENNRERHKIRLSGSVNDIFQTKVNGLLPKRIVIFAAAGRGKTTAVAKLAFDWVHQKDCSPLKYVPLLFALKMRLMDNGTSIGEAILSQLLGHIDGVSPQSIESFIHTHEGDCIIILDGYDEYCNRISSQKVESNVVEIMRNEMYKRCKVLVMCRPFLEQDFHWEDLQRVYAKMEIEGFTHHDTATYIERFYSADPKVGDELVKYLEGHDIIDDLITVPLLCTMVCHMWEEGRLTDVSTMTNLFDGITHFLLQHRKAKNVIESIPDLKTLLQNLGKVALTGLLADNKKVVFKENEFKLIPQHEAEGIKLGLLTKQTIALRYIDDQGETANTYVEFFHKLTQEHCASKYLCSSQAQLESLLTHIDSDIKALEYENVLRFLVGASNTVCFSIVQHILGLEWRHLNRWKKHRLVLDCVSESASCDEEMTRTLQMCFTDGKLVLDSITASTVIGLEKVPRVTKEKITDIWIRDSTRSSPSLIRRLWEVLRSSCKLVKLRVSSSREFRDLPQITSVRRLEAQFLSPYVQYHDLITSLPHIEEVSVLMRGDDDADGVIYGISRGLRHTHEELRYFALGGSPRARVSQKTVCEFCNMLLEHTRRLEKVGIWPVVMNESDVIRVVNACRQHTTMKEMKLMCGTHVGDELDIFLKGIHQEDGQIKIHVSHSGRHRRYCITHADQ